MGNKDLWAAMKEKDTILAKSDITEEDGNRLGELEMVIAEEDGYSAESDAAALLEGLGIPTDTHEGPMKQLAGGLKLRVLLAQALFGKPQGLLLDEPTNNLDIDSIRWLETFLMAYEGVLITISPRPALPERDLHAHRGHRLRDDHPVPRRVRRHGAPEVPGAQPHRVRERREEEEDRPAAGLRRPLPRRHARLAGAEPHQADRQAEDG